MGRSRQSIGAARIRVDPRFHLMLRRLTQTTIGSVGAEVRVDIVAFVRSTSERRGRCGDGGPWSAASHAIDGNGPAGAEFAATPDVPGVAARTETAAEEPFPAAR